MRGRLTFGVGVALSVLAAGGSLWATEESGEFRLRNVVLAGQERTVLEAFVRHARESAAKLTTEGVAAQCRKAPEMFAWVDFPALDCLNVAYALTGDTRYLDLVWDRFALYRACMIKGPDGYLGWYGSPIAARIPKDNPGVQIDEIQMNFRAIALLSRWVELARTDEAYVAANAANIHDALALMEGQLFPKWDARGFFSSIEGRGGVYHGLDYPIKNGVTLSHEKLSLIVDGLLALHRVTGNDCYLKRALEVGAWFKSCLTLRDRHYEWMSWSPAGRWDVDGTGNAWKVSWIAPDPNGEWYAAAVSIAVSLYRYGLLFSDEDLARLIATQKTMCWNGDLDHPEYRTVDGTTSKWTKGRFLSYPLAHYDPQLTKLAFQGPHEADRIRDAGSAWKGGTAARDYVFEKYVMHALVMAKPQPYAEIGKRFLGHADNRAFYDQLAATRIGQGATPSLRPSDMFPDLHANPPVNKQGEIP